MSDRREQQSFRVLMLVATLGVSALPLVSSPLLAQGLQADRRCEVFRSAEDRANCACALQQGGWVTKVHGKWRWIYPRRHQERHCHVQSASQETGSR